MQPIRKHFRSGLAGALVVWLLYTCFLAANPALHLAVHDDAGQSSHQCAVTLLEKQQVLTSDTFVRQVTLSFGFEQELFLPNLAVLNAVDYRFSPSRAPPV